ncbi:rab-interacting lysosomal protein isoform X1 [Anolis carolinensis]|uniref:rab-interacting lysosomal protein isoform X1 n=1 Tax=Anolis carolinensis TaxID=28377 RepID=UPI002F2B5162
MEGQPSSAPPPPSSWASDPVYRLAGSLGSELQRLSALVGPGAVAGLVTQVVCLLELLEAWAKEKPGLRAAAEQCQAEQRLVQDQDKEEEAQCVKAQLNCTHEEDPRLHAPQRQGGPQDGESTLQKEREVMLRLKEVVDRQRDEIRAQAHEIHCKTRDTEALQEQLERFMAMNQELHRKLAVSQAQLRSALERKQGLEGELRQAQALQRAAEASETPAAQAEECASSSGDPAGNAFSREELRQILQERNELKTSLFLVQEELAYYQRELLNDGRIPSLLLEAVKTTVRRQRKKIRAKMLGTVEESLSSEEEEGEWLAETHGASDCVDSHLPGSRIKSFFGQWYRRGSKGSPPEAWEIVDPKELGLPKEEEEEEGPKTTQTPP